jgi:general stress protein 26
MDVIKHTLPTEDQEDLFPQKSKDKIRKRLQNSKTSFFSANLYKDKRFVPIPLPVQDKKQTGTLWFFVTANNYRSNVKDDDIIGQLLFQGKTYSDFLLMEGTISIVNDRNKIKEYWKPVYRKAFPEGGIAAGLSLIKFTITEGYYWNTKQNMVVALPKKNDPKAGKSHVEMAERKIRMR